MKTKGVLMILTSAFCFAGMNVCIRLAGDAPTIQKALFRNLVAIFIATFILLRSKGSFLPAQKCNWPILLSRALFGVLGVLANFYAVDHLLLSDASMLNKMCPFFAIIFSACLLKETLKPAQVLMLIGAFAGAMCIVKPTFSNLVLIPSMLGFLGGICAGLAYTLVRMASQRGEKSSYIVFFFAAFSFLVLLPPAVLNWRPVTAQQVLALLGAGLCAAGGQFAITCAYRFAPAREISVYDYSQVIFAAFFGFILFGDKPDNLSLLGYFIICSMALLNLWYNAQKN